MRNISKTINAWREIFKVGKVKKKLSMVADWFRSNILRVLDKEGWKDFFVVPRSIDELMDHFSYTDKEYMMTIINALLSDKTIARIKDGKYQILKPLEANGVKIPDMFEKSTRDTFTDYADAVPNRLRGEYEEFSGAINLFNWDDWLTSYAYEAIRRAAFAFTPIALEKPGRFLDGGCGTGVGTSAIWLYYYQKGHIHPQTNLKMYGIDNDEDFINIAKEEFDRITARHKVIEKNEIIQYKELFPEFKVGSVSKIPFEDEFFDYVFMSQVLHWTDAPKSIKEAFRVLRPGGIYFGTNTIVPHTNPYLSIHIKVAEGAHGSFTKKEMTHWLKDAGFSKIKFTSPVTIFRAEKI
ncbi:MAG: class I SAM-dependent methyltransferase [Promethearchaeota archaeon]